MSIVIGIDIGTTSTKTAAFDETGHMIYQANYGYPLITKETGQAEERPQDIINATISGLKEVKANIDITQLKGIGVSSAMHTLILIGRDHQPLTNVYTWADNRSAEIFREKIIEDNLIDLTRNTGVPLHPMLPLAKLLWLKINQPTLWKETRYVIDIKSYILYQVSHQYYADFATANATGLFNIKTLSWDYQLLRYLKLRPEQLPQLVDTTFQIPIKVKGINVPIVIGGSDGTLANFSTPQVKGNFYTVSYGTSAAVRTSINTLNLCENRKLFTYYQYSNNWVVGAPTNNAGNVWTWLKNNILKFGSFQELNDLIQDSPIGSKGVMFMPYVFGERAPIWNPNATGSFIGLTSVHTNADLARSVLEGELYNIDLIINELNSFTKKKPDFLILIGGMARNSIFNQLLADITGYSVYVPESVEASALGASIMAMLSLHLITSPNQVQNKLNISQIYYPKQENCIIYNMLKKNWLNINEKMMKI
ncbi:MAG: gluconokinase [Lactobacillaceae bacterium]